MNILRRWMASGVVLALCAAMGVGAPGGRLAASEAPVERADGAGKLGAEQGAAGAKLKVIMGGTLVNPGAAPVANATILIEGNRITSVLAGGTFKLPDGAEVIRADGKWIIPGLVDSHVHFFQSGGLYTRPDVIDLRKRVPYVDVELANIRKNLQDTFKRYLICGITSVVDVGGPMWNFKVREIARETAAAPRVAVAGPLISTFQPPNLTTDDPPILRVNSVEETRALAGKLLAEKPDLVKMWYIVGRGSTVEAGAPFAVAAAEESHKAGVRFAVHATQLETARAAVAAGADVLVHSVDDKAVDAAFIDALKSRGTIYTTTLIVSMRYRETLGAALRLMPVEFARANPVVTGTLFDVRGIPSAELPERVRTALENPVEIKPNATMMANLKALQDAGVTIAAGTDAGNIGTLHGASLYREFALMREAGLTPMEILTAATINGAKVMGRDAELGSVEKGKLADLVILDGDPLADIQNTQKVWRVVKDGVVYDPKELIGETPEELVQRQLNAYNARDLEAFLAAYSEDAEIWTLPDGKMVGKGREYFRQRYSERFEKSPAIHAEVFSRTSLGNYVVDKERVKGRNDGTVEAIAIYEVKEGRIARVWFITRR